MDEARSSVYSPTKAYSLAQADTIIPYYHKWEKNCSCLALFRRDSSTEMDNSLGLCDLLSGDYCSSEDHPCIPANCIPFDAIFLEVKF